MSSQAGAAGCIYKRRFEVRTLRIAQERIPTAGLCCFGIGFVRAYGSHKL